MAATRRTTTKAGTNGTAKASSGSSTGALVCPECGRTFARPAALGAHRSRTHGIAGSSASAQAQRSRTTRRRGTAASRTRTRTAPVATRVRTAASVSAPAAGVNRDALLAALFPNGVPPRESVIREVAAWLDQAERIAKTR